MGIVNPRPPMRQAERRDTETVLRRHAELMDRFEREGMSREDASRRAFRVVKAQLRKTPTEQEGK